VIRGGEELMVWLSEKRSSRLPILLGMTLIFEKLK
jgi:hypothetical protein